MTTITIMWEYRELLSVFTGDRRQRLTNEQLNLTNHHLYSLNWMRCMNKTLLMRVRGCKMNNIAFF